MSHARRAFSLVPILAMLSGCGQTPPPAAPDNGQLDKKLDDLAQKVAELQTLLVEMKRQQPQADANLRQWITQNLAPGRTTLAEVRELFGHNFVDLDRPDRDDVLTIQYSLDEVAGKKLVLDFTAKPAPWASGANGFDPLGVNLLLHPPEKLELNNLEFGRFFCGFCPHILVDDGQWRLEGKMLPGAIGARRERQDSLVLPRARVRQGQVRLRLANWAPETEHIDQAELAVVAGEADQELDLDARGQPYLWRQSHSVSPHAPLLAKGRDRWQLDLPPTGRSAVLVLELRNTEKFEKQMRAALRDGDGELPGADLKVEFAGGSWAITPLGTKFFRRVLVPLPAGTREVRLSSAAGHWWLRRGWLGEGNPAGHVTWLSPVSAAPGDAGARLRQRDGIRLQLARDEEANLTFALPPELASARPRLFFLLRLAGYYEFAPDALTSK